MTPARLAAARVLTALELGRSTLADLTERGREDIEAPRDRALLLEIATGTVRWRAELDACIAVNTKRSVDSLTPEVRSVLRTGAYQLVHLDRVPPHAAVSESVEVIKALGQARAAGFINAVLRSMTRRDARRALPKRPADPGDTDAALRYLSISLSHPSWLVERWLNRHGFEATEAWCRFNNAPPSPSIRPIAPLTLEDLTNQLRSAGVEAAAARYAPGALQLPPGSLGQLPADLRDRVRVQDEGSQLVAMAAGATSGERVLDVCAAPGGKTVLLREAVGDSGLVVAADLRPARVALLKAQLRRNGLAVPVVALDATAPLPFGGTFDRVLLDAPCSGLGTLRRDPDLKWSRRESDLAAFARAQLTMMERVASVVKTGGALVYATCSSEPDENEAVVDAFLSSNTAFRSAPITGLPPQLLTPRGFLQTRPDRDELDMFFAAKLVRSATA